MLTHVKRNILIWPTQNKENICNSKVNMYAIRSIFVYPQSEPIVYTIEIPIGKTANIIMRLERHRAMRHMTSTLCAQHKNHPPNRMQTPPTGNLFWNPLRTARASIRAIVMIYHSASPTNMAKAASQMPRRRRRHPLRIRKNPSANTDCRHQKYMYPLDRIYIYPKSTLFPPDNAHQSSTLWAGNDFLATHSHTYTHLPHPLTHLCHPRWFMHTNIYRRESIHPQPQSTSIAASIRIHPRRCCLCPSIDITMTTNTRGVSATAMLPPRE